jgi:hypothetical protein
MSDTRIRLNSTAEKFISIMPLKFSMPMKIAENHWRIICSVLYSCTVPTVLSDSGSQIAKQDHRAVNASAELHVTNAVRHIVHLTVQATPWSSPEDHQLIGFV